MNNPGKYSGLDFDWVTYAEKALTRACRQALASYQASHEVRKLQLGSSYLRLDNWFNTDVIPSKDVFFLDTRRPFPFENSLFHYVFSEHHIEHLSFEEGLFTLQECYRVLVPGGKFRIATPDLTTLLSLYTSEPDEMQSRYVQFIAKNFIPKASTNLPAFVINNAFRNWGHQFIYDQATLQWVMEQAGFVEITRTSPGESGDEHLRGIEQHGLPHGDEGIKRFETIVLEEKRPLLTEEKRPVLAKVKVDQSEKENQQRYEVGVMCSGSLSQDDPRWAQAYQLGKLLAQEAIRASWRLSAAEHTKRVAERWVCQCGPGTVSSRIPGIHSCAGLKVSGSAWTMLYSVTQSLYC